MNRGRYPSYGMYLNRRVNKLNCCCEPGPTGSKGSAGPTGYPGTAVNTGATGPTGPAGGPPGPIGPTGPAGTSNTGATGMTGPVGPNPSAGLNAALPYEPWNLDIGFQSVKADTKDVYYVQFIAPSTAQYTKMTIFLVVRQGIPPGEVIIKEEFMSVFIQMYHNWRGCLEPVNREIL